MSPDLDPTETLVREQLRRELDAVEVPPSPGVFRSAAQGSAVTRRVLVGAAAASALGVAVAGSQWARRPSGTPAPPAGAAAGGAARVGSWRTLAPLPLSPRSGMHGLRVGQRALFLGGSLALPCPPTASCLAPTQWPTDGAIFDPAVGTWRTFTYPGAETSASAPVPVGDRAVFASGTAWLAVSAATGEVAALPAWTGAEPLLPLTSDGRRVYAVRQSDEVSATVNSDGAPEIGTATAGRVRVLDLSSGAWSELPADPLGPSFDRSLIWCDSGLVVLAKKLVASPGGADGPALVRAAVFADGAWRRLPDLDCIGGWSWRWTGRRLVSPLLGGADGGETNGYGRTIAFHAWLDPVTGQSGPLPDAPASEAITQWVDGPADKNFMVVQGWLYDDDAGTWTRLTRPGGGQWIDSAGVLLDRQLIVAGGYDQADDYRSEAGLTAAAWQLKF